MAKTVSYYEFEEARIEAGLFFDRLLEELCVEKRTLSRWKKQNRVPGWAMKIVELLSGDLAIHGWPEWELKKGLLFNKNLSDCYAWTAADVAITAYCPCPAHREIRKIKNGEAVNDAPLPAGVVRLRLNSVHSRTVEN